MINLLDWIKEYWQYVLAAIVILFLIFRHKIFSMFYRRAPIQDKPEEQEQPMFYETFLQPFNIVSSLNEQRKAAEQALAAIKAEGKNMAKDEKDIENAYLQQKMMLYHRKQDMGLRYSTWSNHLNNINQMIANQYNMDKRMKEMGKNG